MNLPRTIFFDAADTLIELAEPVATVYARHFATAGYPVEESAIRQAFGKVFSTLPPPDYEAHPDGDLAEQDWWRSVVRETAARCTSGLEGRDFDRLFEALFAHYARGQAYRVFPEVEGVLGSLRDAGCQLAVVSNFDRRLHRILAELGLAPWFSAIISSADARSRKPAPRIFRFALETLGRHPSEVAHIGDSAAADYAGAENVGIRAFLLDRPRVTLYDALDWIRSGFAGK